MLSLPIGPLCWVSLSWVSLCWMPWRRSNRYICWCWFRSEARHSEKNFCHQQTKLRLSLEKIASVTLCRNKLECFSLACIFSRIWYLSLHEWRILGATTVKFIYNLYIFDLYLYKYRYIKLINICCIMRVNATRNIPQQSNYYIFCIYYTYTCMCECIYIYICTLTHVYVFIT